jgi:hypothetical protein
MKAALLLLIFVCWPCQADPCGDRIHSVLSRAFPEGQAPVRFDVKPRELDILELDKNLMNEAKGGKEYTYFVDTYGQVHLMDGKQALSDPSDFIMIRKPGKNEVLIIRETGHFRYDPGTKRYLFDPKEGWDITPEENLRLVQDLEQNHPGSMFRREPNPRMDRARVFSCADALSAQQQGKGFVWDSLVSSNVVSVAGMVTQEMMGNHVLTDPEKRKLIYADLIANNITTSITSPIVKKLVVNNAGVLRDFTVRTTSEYLTNQFIKKPIYDEMTPKKPEEKTSVGEKLVPYDTGFAVMRFFPKRALDRFLVNRLPQMMLKSCLKGNKVMAAVGPKVVRIADRYTWGVIYLGGRTAYLDAVDEKNDSGK